eukprot:gnl/TRDRNA2_/TRDRNA2_149052_c0_seq1.p1 gnl/TRDRNA2_/TRDRNA2_149052_c0~~gnl/TRDRNA2_/TRDRNA2_149052_c0_seq1.p1  ORF type:complete len:282 (+),score=33.41 gnl/TRDRNA2_/TRDRNA2_149052_c0_seq1:1-846(+)
MAAMKAVKSVQSCAPPRATTDNSSNVEERVSVSVLQPERHCIFVASPEDACGNALPTCMMACGSADANAQLMQQEVKHTFVNIVDQEAELRQLRPRASSAPPSLHGDDTVKVPKADTCASKPAAQSPRALPLVTLRPPRPSFSSQGGLSGISNSSPPSWHQSTKSTSHNSSAISEVSAVSAEVILGNGMQPVFSTHGSLVSMQRLEDVRSKSHIKLSPVVHVKMRGLPSLGSVDHDQGQCRVCAFNSISGKTCKMGSLCERCHESHTRTNSRRMAKKSMRL